MKDRKVTLSFHRELYNFCLAGEAKYRKNRRLSMFSLTQGEAEQVFKLLEHQLRIKEHRRTDLNEKDN